MEPAAVSSDAVDSLPWYYFTFFFRASLYSSYIGATVFTSGLGFLINGL